MKKSIVICSICAALLAGCGNTVPVTMYDELKTENDSLRAENEELHSEIESYLANDYENKNAELEKMNAQLQKRIDQYENKAKKDAAAEKEEKAQAVTQYTELEEFAAKYLVAFSGKFKNPYSVQVKKVWYWNIGDSMHYIAYELTAQNELGADIYGIYGNKLSLDGITDADIEDAKKGLMSFDTIYDSDSVIKNGKNISASKVQKLYEKYL